MLGFVARIYLWTPWTTVASLVHRCAEHSPPEALPMTLRRSITLLVSAAALIAAAACASPTAPHGCDIVTTSGSSAC